MSEVQYNTENLIVKDIKTYVGNIEAGTYYRGQLLVNTAGLWTDAGTFDGAKQLGVYLGSGESPKTYTANAWDSIIVFGDVYAGGLVNSTGTVRTLNEEQIGLLQQSGIFVRKI